MRGYGESTKPKDIRLYGVDKLVEDVKKIIEYLGLYFSSKTITLIASVIYIVIVHLFSLAISFEKVYFLALGCYTCTHACTAYVLICM